MGFFNIFSRNKEVRSQDTADNEVVNPCYSNAELGLLGALFNKLSDPMKLSGVFASINMISNSVASMPVSIKKYAGVNIEYTDFIKPMLRNGNMTKFLFMKNMVKDVLIQGNGYAFIQRDKDKKPVKFIYLPPETVTVFYNSTNYEINYYVSTALPQFKKISPSNMIHLMMNTKNGVVGKGVLDFATDAIDLSGYTDKTAKNFFKSGGMQQGILTMNIDNPNLNIKQEKLDELKRIWQQGSNKGEDGSTVRILPANMKYQPITSNANDSQMIQTRTFNLQEIARFFSISPVLIGDLSKNTYGTIEQSQIEYVLHCLMAYVEMVQDEFTRKLIPEDLQYMLYVDLDESYLIKGDNQSFANYLKTLTSGGIMSLNEARMKLGLDTVDDENANKLIIPYSDINQNTVGEVDDNKNTETEDDEK